jgi:ribosomal protein L40E
VEERRCPSCSALVSEDAEWCGQCFTSLRAKTSDPEPAGTLAPIAEPAKAGGGATWPCPACGESNPIELDACRVCGTPFAQLFREPTVPPTISPRDAFLWSLTFPGVGHAKAGRTGDGVARATLFVLAFGLTLVIAFSGATGPLRAVVILLLVSSLTVYLGSAYEAYRIADGGDPLVSSRALLWTTVVFVMLSIGLLTASVFTAGAR